MIQTEIDAKIKGKRGTYGIHARIERESGSEEIMRNDLETGSILSDNMRNIKVKNALKL